MATATVRTAFQQASQGVRALATKAEEAIDERVHATTRTVRTAQHRAEDAADDAAACVRKQPLTAVSVAFGAGIALGVAGGLLAAAMYSWYAE